MNIFCDKCQRLEPETNFWKKRSGNYHTICKSYYRDIVDPYDTSTFLPLLKELDIPYIPDEWNHVIQWSKKEKSKNTIGRYIAKMNLTAFKSMTFQDTDRFIKPPRKYFRRGVIYTTNLEKGKMQLQKIVDEKKAKGIHYDQVRQSQYGVDVYFDDMTWWHIALNFESARGLRWVDAYIDEDISIKFLREIIMPKQIKDIETDELGEVHYF